MLTREEFRAQVFKRDNNVCVVPKCGRPAVDAHHILERALWGPNENFGYVIENGASLCEIHHIHAEKNFFPPAALRRWAGITRRVLPSALDPAIDYTKWGDKLPMPNRTIVKYSHTPYFSFSPGVDQLDVDEAGFLDEGLLVGKPLMISIKMDGSNALLTREKVAARNAYDAPHKSFDYLKVIHAGIKHLIPKTQQVFCEWLYAHHSIHYKGNTALDSLCQILAVYDQKDHLWLGWDDVCNMAEQLGLITVPVVEYVTFENKWEIPKKVSRIGEDVITRGHEGIVVRSVYPFHYGQFRENIGKYVREGHVQTDEHWMTRPIVKNEVKAPLVGRNL